MICVKIRSLVNPLNYSKLEPFLTSLKLQPDMIAITETWIQPTATSISCNNLKGYTFTSNSRMSCKGGGVGLYIKNSITFTTCNELTIMHEKNFNHCLLLSKLLKKLSLVKLLIGHQLLTLNPMNCFCNI